MKTTPSIFRFAAVVLFALFCTVSEAAPPADIQALFQTINRENVNYPSRADDLDTLNRWYKDGDFDLVRSKAKDIIEQQRNVKAIKAGKTPADIQALFQTINRENVNYPSRADDLDTLNRWYKDGDFDLVRSKAKDIIKQQRNVNR